MASSSTTDGSQRESSDASRPPRKAIRALSRVHRGIGFRLTLVLTSCLLVLLGVSGVFGLKLHRQHLMELLEEEAIGMGETILSSAHYAMLENDRDHIAQIVDNVGRRDRVLALRLLDGRGVVRYASRPEQVGEVVAMDQAACIGCHGEKRVEAPISLRDALGVYHAAQGEEAMGLVVPVLNAKECWEAACHVHPESRRVLGVLDLELSTASLEKSIEDDRRQMLQLGGVTIAALCLVLGLITWRFVHRPIHALLAGTRRIAQGDLSHRLPSNPGSGELTELTTSFNVMTARLDVARKERERWNQELEERVAEKTRELERSRSQMLFAEKMVSLGKLAAIVAHEINNPLAGILVSVKTVRKRLGKLGETPDEGIASFKDRAGKMLQLVEQETTRCGDIVRNLLLFSRRREAAKSDEDVNQIVRRSMLLVSHQAELQEVESRLDLDETLPEVICDAGQIEQACVALIMNAIEAMPTGGTLRVSTRFRPETARVRVSVRDTGVGIAEENREKIFEPFFTTKTEEKGTGLGLSVLYGIIQRHAGVVDFTSRAGEGTTFFFEIPVNGDASDGTREAATGAAAARE